MPNCDDKKPIPTPIRPVVNPYLRSVEGKKFRIACLKDALDLRDKTANSLTFLTPSNKDNKKQKALPNSSDLTATGNFTVVEDQGQLGSCTANAVVGVVEYLIKAATGKTLDLSRIFLYKATRNLMGDQGIGDSGAYIRDTIKALRLFGTPPEKWWPYNVDAFDDEPDAFIYSIAQNFQTIEYARLDPYGAAPNDTLQLIKQALNRKYPIAFGFWVPEGMGQVSRNNPFIPIPDMGEKFVGGHAVVAVGYDDQKNALKIRNSWGLDWAESGHAWLPYEYVEQEFAFDFWTVFNNEWVVS